MAKSWFLVIVLLFNENRAIFEVISQVPVTQEVIIGGSTHGNNHSSQGVVASKNPYLYSETERHVLKSSQRFYFYISSLDIEFDRFACVWDQLTISIDESDNLVGPFCGDFPENLDSQIYEASKSDLLKIHEVVERVDILLIADSVNRDGRNHSGFEIKWFEHKTEAHCSRKIVRMIVI